MVQCEGPRGDAIHFAGAAVLLQFKHRDTHDFRLLRLPRE